MSVNSQPNSTNLQLYQFKMISDNQKEVMIRHFMSQVKMEDMLNVGFMKPIEVALRTNRFDKSVPTDSLPQGLMLADKKTINDNKYQLKKFLPLDQTFPYSALKQKFMDNYISLLKKSEVIDMVPVGEDQSQASKSKNNEIELGICISMENQDKKILKRTLVGVADNVDQMIRSGVSPDDIFVVVVIDGVLKVDPTVYEFFEQLQRQSQIYLEEDEQLTLKKKYENSLYHAEIEVQEPLNFSKFLFKQEQFYERIESKFQNVRKRYDEVLRIKKSVQNIKKQKNKDNDNLKRIINIMMDKQKQIMKKINNGSDKTNVLISQESIMKELASSEEECNQYISTRDQLSYVSAYRVPTTSLSPRCKEKQTNASSNQNQSETERMYEDESIDKTTRELSDDNIQKNITNKSKRYVNLLFCIKYKENGKLSSHNWFFNGFCNELKPKYSVLLDVGVRPYQDAIFKMYRYLKINQNVGSVCGYLRLIQQKVEDDEMTKSEDVDCISSILINLVDIQRAQQLQYHFENMLDKPFESLFKFIHVLPGAFSAYSMDALMPKHKKDSLLRQYFKSMAEKMTTNKIVTSTFPARQILLRIFFPKAIWKLFIKIDPDSEQQVLYNEIVNLAEDRILCLGIHKNQKDIIFMPDVFAQVEPIKMINDLMGQRQKSINGGLHSFERVSEELHRSDTKTMTFFLSFQLLYLGFSKFLSTFAPALLLFTCHVTMNLIQVEYLGSLLANRTSASIGSVIYATFTNIVDFFYTLMLLAIFFFSLHLRHDHKKFIYYIYLISTMMGLFTIIAFTLYIIDIINSFIGVDNYIRKQYQNSLNQLFPGNGIFFANLLRYVMLSSISVIIVPVTIYSIFFRKLSILWDMLIGTLSFLFYSPTYLNILQIYSKCRLDDISSGKKSNLGSQNQKMKQSWKTIKMIEVSKFLIWNLIAGVTLILLDSSIYIQFFALLFILGMFTIVQSIKLIFGLTYMIQYKCNMRSNPLSPTPKQIEDNQETMHSRIFDIINRFQIQIRNQIEQSFRIASQETEYRKFAEDFKKEQKQSKSPKKEAPNSANLPKNKTIQEQQSRLHRQSIKLIQQFQDSRFKNIRDSAAIKKDFYPEHVNGKKQVKPVVNNPQTPLQLLLLKQQLNNSTLNNQDLKIGQQKLKQYETFRGTMKPTIGV